MFSLHVVQPPAIAAGPAAPLTDDPCSRRRNLLVRGNKKLGPDLLAFSLPAVATCPGRTGACEAVCYARAGNFAWPAVAAQHTANLAATRRADFVGRMVRELKRRLARVVRWHVAGDVYGAAYARKLWEVVRQTPDVTHHFYTRSWRHSRVKPMLLLAAEPNVRQWWSCDRDSGAPFPVPHGVRLAWMMSYPEEEQTHADHIAACHLVFRVRRRGPPSRSPG